MNVSRETSALLRMVAQQVRGRKVILFVLEYISKELCVLRLKRVSLPMFHVKHNLQIIRFIPSQNECSVLNNPSPVKRL